MELKKLTNVSWILSALMVLGFASCKKLNSEGFTPGNGAPTITSVRTLSKSVVDSSRIHSTTTYNSSGVASTTSYNDYTPVTSAFDSTTVTGNLNQYYVLLGSNLGTTTNIAINGVTIYFNRAFSSDHSVIFQIPTTVPYVQPQPNTIVVTTLYGKVTYKFTTLPPPPTITAVTDYDFWANSQITLTGKGFASVSAVSLRATKDAMKIVSQNDSTLVLQAPATSAATESTLLFKYTSGSNPNAQTASTTIFNDLDNGYVIFYQNSFQNSWGDNSWSHPSGVQTGTAHAFGGTSSLEASYPSNAWQIEGWVNWWPGLAYDPSYKYLTFWVKGGSVDQTLTLVGDKAPGGYGQVQPASGSIQQIDVPPGVWTYYKIPLASSQSSTSLTTLNFWATGSPSNELGFFLKGQSSDPNEAIWFDEVAFIK